MALGDLITRLVLDNRPFDAGLDKGKKKVGEFEMAVGKVGGRLRSSLLGFFSISAVSRLASGLNSAVREIDQIADQFSISTQEAQKLQQQAELTNQTIEKLVETAGGLPQALRESSAEVTRFTDEELSAVRGARAVGQEYVGILGRLARFAVENSNLGKLALGGGRISDLDTREGVTGVRAMQAKVAAQEAALEAAKAQREFIARQYAFPIGPPMPNAPAAAAAARERASSLRPVDSDSIRAIGNFLGSNPTGQNELRTLQEINRVLVQILNVTQRGNSTALRLPIV